MHAYRLVFFLLQKVGKLFGISGKGFLEKVFYEKAFWKKEKRDPTIVLPICNRKLESCLGSGENVFSRKSFGKRLFERRKREIQQLFHRSVTESWKVVWDLWKMFSRETLLGKSFERIKRERSNNCFTDL
jgi:hypothetical protein